MYIIRVCIYIYTYTCTYVCIYSIQTYIVYGCERNSHVWIKLCDRRSSVFRSAIWWKPQQIKRSGLWAGVWHFGQLLVRHQTGTTGKLGDWKSWILIHYGKPLDSCVNLLDLYFFIGFAFAIILSTERLSSTPLSRNRALPAKENIYPYKANNEGRKATSFRRFLLSNSTQFRLVTTNKHGKLLGKWMETSWILQVPVLLQHIATACSLMCQMANLKFGPDPY